MKSKISESLNQELRSVLVRPELRMSILASARNARYRRRRRRFRAFSAVAAVLAIALAIVGGIKFMRKPVPDRKVSGGDYTSVWIDETERTYHAKSSCVNRKMSVVSLSEARARGFSACTRCIRVLKTPMPTIEPTIGPTIEPTITPTIGPTIEPTAAPTIEPTAAVTPQPTSVSEEIDYETSCYMTDGGKWYHAALNCQNMQGAYETNVRYAIESGKTACPVCWGQEVVWMTDGGICYHRAEHCQNMMYARQVDSVTAEEAGKQRCTSCFVEPDDAAWMEMIGNGISVQIEAAEANGRVFLYLSNAFYAVPLYGDPIETELESEDLIASTLQELSENRLNPQIVSSAAEEIAAGRQIGVRTLCYQIDKIRAFDADGAIEVGDVLIYMESDSETGILCIAETDGSRTPTRVSAEVSLYGVSYYMDADGNWHALETKYAANVRLEDENDWERASAYCLYVTEADDAAPAYDLESEVQKLDHISYSALNGCAMDAYGYEADPNAYSMVLFSAGDSQKSNQAYAETLFEQLYQEETGNSLIHFAARGESKTTVLILEAPIAGDAFDNIIDNMSLMLNAMSNMNPPVGSETRASAKSVDIETDSSETAAEVEEN